MGKSESLIPKIAIFSYRKCPVLKKQIKRQILKPKYYDLYPGKKAVCKTFLKKIQMRGMLNKHFKSAILNVVKEAKENMRMMYFQIQNTNIEIEIIKKDQVEILKLKCTIIVMRKNSLDRFNNKFEQAKELISEVKID